MPHHLLDNIVQVLTLANLHAFVLVSFVLLYSRRIGSAFIDIDQAGFAVGTDSFNFYVCRSHGVLETPWKPHQLLDPIPEPYVTEGPCNESIY